MEAPSASPDTPPQESKPLFHRVLRMFCILAVLLIPVGVILTLITTNMGPCENPADIAARAQIMTLSTAVKMYQVRHRALPPTIASLVMPPANAAGKQTFIEAGGILDPWGRQFIYKSPGKDGKPYDIYSAGPDGVDGTEDDIHPN
jgi:general secretion pathway protein G